MNHIRKKRDKVSLEIKKSCNGSQMSSLELKDEMEHDLLNKFSNLMNRTDENEILEL
jgi:Fe-S cluster biogenesis protein NfuA